jgi:malonate-semialdehyde dehydrogenase (acetylating)/methylmalonate-semialdehyde dehydrogenase
MVWVYEHSLKALLKSVSTEIFGPVLTVVHAETIEDAIQLVNNNQCKCCLLMHFNMRSCLIFPADGNGASIFTASGANARLFERTIEAGQLGVNVPIPVPLPAWSWSGNKASVLGGHSLYGKL